MKKRIVMLLLSFSLIGCGPSTTAENTTIGKIEEVEEIKPEESQEEAKNEEISPAKVGEFIQGETWKISLLDAKQYDVIPDEYFETKPDIEGNKFVVLFFEVENISDSDEHFNMFFFESYVDDYSIQSKMLLSDVEGYSALSGDVASGKKLKGYVAFEVESDWQEIEYSYKNFIGTSSKEATFIITPDQLSQ